MSCLAVITARGGSKRIPKKNIKEFCGKPIIAYSIEAALESGVFEEVMVSTDSEEIAEIAREYGASVPFMRSERTSSDFATTSDVLDEVIETYRRHAKFFDYFCCLYPTAPFITVDHLQSAYQKLKDSEADALITVVKYDFPPQRAFIIENGVLAYEFPEYAQMRSQDLRPIYHDCGQFYFYRTHSFVNRKAALCEKTIPFVLNSMEVQDIDTVEDWEIAENKMKVLLGRRTR